MGGKQSEPETPQKGLAVSINRWPLSSGPQNRLLVSSLQRGLERGQQALHIGPFGFKKGFATWIFRARERTSLRLPLLDCLESESDFQGAPASGFLRSLGCEAASRYGSLKGLEERPLKGPLRLYRGFMRQKKARKGLYRVLGLGVPSRVPLLSLNNLRGTESAEDLQAAGFSRRKQREREAMEELLVAVDDSPWMLEAQSSTGSACTGSTSLVEDM